MSNLQPERTTEHTVEIQFYGYVHAYGKPEQVESTYKIIAQGLDRAFGAGNYLLFRQDGSRVEYNKFEADGEIISPEEAAQTTEQAREASRKRDQYQDSLRDRGAASAINYAQRPPGLDFPEVTGGPLQYDVHDSTPRLRHKIQVLKSQHNFEEAAKLEAIIEARTERGSP